jgi:hypothetical protein
MKFSLKRRNLLSKKTTRSKFCSPDNEKNGYTCFNRDSLQTIIKAYNNNHKDKIRNYENKSDQQLWNLIDGRMKQKKCYSEWCWVEQQFVKNLKDSKLKGSFRPNMPREWKKNPSAWLSTTDIQRVMKQYETAHDDFHFVGPVPIDFDSKYDIGKCIVNELCNVNIVKMHEKGKTKLGVVFNLDAHDEPGSHWVSMFADTKQRNVFYYDSYGLPPPDEIKKLMVRLSEQGIKIPINRSNSNKLGGSASSSSTGNLLLGTNTEQTNPKFGTYYNNVRHQFKNSECGVYSMHFLSEFLNGKTFSQIINNRVNDEEINKKRKFFYKNDLV